MRTFVFGGVVDSSVRGIDFRKLCQLPLVALFCASRSGVTLLQTLFDGHPEVLQIPTQLKLYDFLDSRRDAFTAEQAVREFADFPSHDHLFDTSLSGVMHKDRLGENRDVRVVVDKERFVRNAVHLLGDARPNARELVVAAVVAYNICIGRDVRDAKAVLAHIHHGDWLFPEHLVEKFNLSPPPSAAGIDVLRPDKALIAVRNPVETLQSLEAYAAKHESSALGAEESYSRYLRMYVQDVMRVDYCESSGLPTYTARLDRLRVDTRAETDKIAAWIGVATGRPEVLLPTAYGFPWHGDPATEPSTKPKAQPPIVPLSPTDPDHALILLTIGRRLAAMGYVAPSMLRPWPFLVAFTSMCFRQERRRFWRSADAKAARWRLSFFRAVRQLKRRMNWPGIA